MPLRPGVACPRRHGQMPQLGFMADKFQPDFYVACATVIPVLFLAVAVEGRVYRWALSTSERAQRYSNTTVRTAPSLERPAQWAMGWRWAGQQLADLTATALLFIAMLIVIAGGLGEGLALFVLCQKSETTSERGAVLIATLVLVAAVIAGPVVALGRSLWSVILSPMYAPYWRLAVQYWQQYVRLWRRWRAAQSWREYVQLLRVALITFGGGAVEGQSTASPEGRRESKIRPHYDA